MIVIKKKLSSVEIDTNGSFDRHTFRMSYNNLKGMRPLKGFLLLHQGKEKSIEE